MSRFRTTLMSAVLVAGTVSWADEPPFVATAPPRSPEEELASFKLPPGFEAQLVAAEPDIQKPINMAFDSRGRLWVTCTIEYPYPAKDRPGRDTVKILDNFGPDGRARKISTFAHGLNIPIGVLPYDDGAIVYSIPNVWRLRDTHGDGKSDKQDVLLTGFGHRDTHGMISSLVRGFDGWVYACHGYSNDSDVTAKDGSRIVVNSGNTFRFKTDGSRIEMMCRGQVNPFGQCFDPLGNMYTACCHSKPITQLIRGAVFTSFAKPHDGLGFGPDMVHEYRGSTALCGLSWYDAEHFPVEYRGRMFLGDVVYNCINIFDIERIGATYTAKQRKTDFLASTDPWFRPVDIKLGPDGALYVADFYNRIIGHYEVPLDHPGRDRTSGRIWRIIYKGTDGKGPAPASPLRKWSRPASQDYMKNGPDATVVRELGNPNITVRMLAMEELGREARSESATDAVSPMRIALNAATKGDNALQQVHALWMLERLNRHDAAAVQSARKSKELLLRAHGYRILAEQANWTDSDRAEAIAGLSDTDGLVRRIAADALARHPSADGLRALLALRAQPGTIIDPFLLHGVRIAIRDHIEALDDDWQSLKNVPIIFVTDAALGVHNERAANNIAGFIRPIVAGERDRLPEYVHHVARYAQVDKVRHVLAYLEDELQDSVLRGRSLLALARGLQERGTALDSALAERTAKLSRQLIESADPVESQLGIDLISTLRYRPLYANVAIVGCDRQRPDKARIAALASLATLDGPSFAGTLAARLADASESLELRERVAQALAGVNSPAARSALLDAIAAAQARLANSIAAGLAGNRDGADVLLQAIVAGKASPRLLLERSVRVKLDALKAPPIQDQIAKLTEGLPPPDSAMADLLRRRAESFANAKPDAAAGAKVFTKHCANCHQIGGQGTKIGPQLDGIGVRGVERLLEDTLDPNRNVDQSFRMTTINLKSGQTLNGLVLREEGAVVIVADNQGKEQRIDKSRIDSREVSSQSPMPANWADQIAEKDFNDLLAYLLGQRAK